MNLETKITIYKFTPQVFTLTHNLRDFFFGPPCFSAKIELHFTLNYAAHVNQDVNRKVYTLAVSVGIPCKKYRCP